MLSAFSGEGEDCVEVGTARAASRQEASVKRPGLEGTEARPLRVNSQRKGSLLGRGREAMKARKKAVARMETSVDQTPFWPAQRRKNGAVLKKGLFRTESRTGRKGH
jgi:hypothetical protein